jgi:catechol 2,3-dioxygenase-like lactoylglutathione lyase family enzyme
MTEKEQAVTRFIIVGLLCGLAGAVAARSAGPEAAPNHGDTRMELGNFSVSLAVKDLQASRAFYEKLGFRVVAGDAKGYLILQNATATIGLFQGMFDKNIMTFNPGWDRNCATLPDFQDVRDIQKVLEERGIKLTSTADESSTGPANLTLADPDGNQILLDQHVPRPRK